MYFELLELPTWVLTLSQVLLSTAMLLSGWRIWKGPTIADRIVALDLLASLLLSQFIWMTFMSRFISYLDVATIVAIISFIATVSIARYLEQQEARK